ncbi:MAG: hypothetical protein NE330_01715 [Lentisphaeraceae bacterium]|nr:hypothetical protein [Lentisphaeraceae bacterium]
MNFKKFFLGLVAFHFILIIGYAMNQKSDEYYRKTHPHVKVRSKNFIIDSFIPRRRLFCNSWGKERSFLKQLGTTVAMYYSDDTTEKYPANPQDLDFDISILQGLKRGPQYLLPKNWAIPNNWQEFNNSKAFVIFLRTPKDSYTESAKVPLFIIRQNFNVNPDCISLVYENGQLGCVQESEAIALWKSAGVWNEPE